MPDQFAFLRAEWPSVYEDASKAEAAALPDPRTACFHARRGLESAVQWAFRFDTALRRPYQDNVSALIHEPTFKATAGEAVFAKARAINTLGNRAVHGTRPVHQADSLAAVRDTLPCLATGWPTLTPAGPGPLPVFALTRPTFPKGASGTDRGPAPLP